MDAPITFDASELLYPEWQKPLQAALLELDEVKLQARTADAREAISNRLFAISQESIIATKDWRSGMP